MRRVILMRHAKSSWADPGMDDFDRPLNQRGLEAAPKMGRWYAEHHGLPDIVLSSPAKRAEATTNLWIEGAGFQGEVRWTPSLYLASPTTIIRTLSQLDDRFESAMIVAHNPGLEELGAVLGRGYQAFPTAAMACYVAEVSDWRSLMVAPESVSWRLDFFAAPKGLA